MKQKKVVKRLLIFGTIVLIMFAVINLVWFIGIKIPYDNLSEGMERIQGPTLDGITRIYHTESRGGYEFNIKNSSYLSNNGYLSVIDESGMVVIMDEDGNAQNANDVYITLFIWPKLFAGFEYGVDVQKEGMWEQIYIDKDGNYIPEDTENVELNEYMESLLKEYETEIQGLLKAANEQWELN